MSIDPLKPIPWPMQVQPQNRTFLFTYDALNVNVYQEKMADGEVHSIKRPAFQLASLGSAGYPRGAHQRLFILDKNVSSLTAGLLGNMNAGSNAQHNATFADLDFASLDVFINSGFRDGTSFYIAGSSVTGITGPKGNHGGPYVPGVVWLNGTVYLMTYDGKIYGSDVGAYTTWQSGNVIATNVQASVAIALAKQKVYVVAFSRFGTTVFYNAGNPTGSPLTLLPGGQSAIGCYDACTIQSVGDDLYWVGTPSTVSLSVYKMSDLKITKVSTPAIDRILSSATYLTYPYNLVGDNPNLPTRSMTLAIHGHRYYILNLSNLSFSLVYDTEFNLWYVWQAANFGSLPYFTPLSYGGNIATESYINYTQPQLNIFQGTNGILYRFNANAYIDHDGPFTARIVTDNFDAGTRVRKHFPRFEFLTDQVPFSTMTVERSDDDYQSWKNPRTVDLSKPFPYLTNLGTFRRRAYRFSHTADTAFRLKGANAYLVPGSL